MRRIASKARSRSSGGRDRQYARSSLPSSFRGILRATLTIAKILPRSCRLGNPLLLIFRLNPFAVFANQIYQPVHGFGFGDVEFDWRFADVEVDLVRRSAHVSEVRVGHFARTVHNATHDGDLDA